MIFLLQITFLHKYQITLHVKRTYCITRSHLFSSSLFQQTPIFDLEHNPRQLKKKYQNELNLDTQSSKTSLQGFLVLSNTMGTPKCLKSCGVPYSISIGPTMPTIATTNFEIKPVLLNMIQQNQFGGHPNEDPANHLQRFQQFYHTGKHKGITPNQLKVMVFEFSLHETMLKCNPSYFRGFHKYISVNLNCIL